MRRGIGTMSRRIVAGGAALVAVAAVAPSTIAQMPAYCWTDATTGRLVPSVPQGESAFVGGAQSVFVDRDDPNKASNIRTGETFVRRPDGSWIDGRTGQLVPTTPQGESAFVSGAQSVFVDKDNPNQALNIRTGQRFIRTPCR